MVGKWFDKKTTIYPYPVLAVNLANDTDCIEQHETNASSVCPILEQQNASSDMFVTDDNN